MGVISFASNLENQTFICQAADKDLIKDKMTFNFLKADLIVSILWRSDVCLKVLGGLLTQNY